MYKISFFRTELGFCSISWSSAPNNFMLSNANIAAGDQTGDPCSSDYVVIVGGYTADVDANNDRYCGVELQTPENAAGTILCKNIIKFCYA